MTGSRRIAAGVGPADRPFNEALRLENRGRWSGSTGVRAIARNVLSLAQVPDMAALPAIREIADRLDGKPKQETEVSLRTAVARELSDDDVAAIAVGTENKEIEPDPKPDLWKLN